MYIIIPEAIAEKITLNRIESKNIRDGLKWYTKKKSQKKEGRIGIKNVTQIETEEQNGRSKSNHINNYIKGEWVE